MKNFKLFEKCNRRIARRVTLIAVLLAMCMPQAWAWIEISSANVYYDNSSSNWDESKNVVIAIERLENWANVDNHGCGVFAMGRIANTKLWRWAGSFGYNDINGYRFGSGAKTYDWYAWWYDNGQGETTSYGLAGRDNWANVSGFYQESMGNVTKIFGAISSDRAANLSKKDISTFPGDMNYTQNVYYSVCEGAGSYSKLTTGTTPAKIQISSYKFVSEVYDAVSSETPDDIAAGGTTRTRSFTAGHTATTQITVSNIVDGYEFMGWYDAASGGNQLEDAEHLTYTYYPKSACDVYARFRKTTYSLAGENWNTAGINWAAGTVANGGTRLMTTTDGITYSTTMTGETLGGSTRSFKLIKNQAWDANAIAANTAGVTKICYNGTLGDDGNPNHNFTLAPYLAGAITVSYNTSTTTLTVTCEEPIITFSKDGGDGGTSSQKTYSTKVTSSVEKPSKTGYKFDGYWSDDDTPVQVIDKDGNWKRNISGYTDNSDPCKWSTSLNSNHTFTAHWTAKTYNLTLNQGNGTGASSKVTMTYNSSSHASITAPTPPTGYSFVGWYTGSGGTGSMVMNASGVLQVNVDGYTGAGGIWTKDGSCTLFAKYTANYPDGYIYITDVMATPVSPATSLTLSSASFYIGTGGIGSTFQTNRSGYEYWARISGSSSSATLTFSSELDLSSYSEGVDIYVWWGSDGNHTTSISVNGGDVVAIDNIPSSAERNLVREATYHTGVSSLSSIVLKGSNAGVTWFRIGIKETEAPSCSAVPTVSTTTLGTTTTTTQVVNCAGISSLGTGTCTISDYGFVYGTSEDPTVSDNKVQVGTTYTTTNVAFDATTIESLTPGATYYVRAYATNGYGTAYGTGTSFTTHYAITTGSHTNGSVTIPSSAAPSASVAISATPSTGYTFSSWTIKKTSDGSDVTESVSLSGTTSATFTMPDYAVTVDATFSCTTPTITGPSDMTVCKDDDSPELSVSADANGGSLSYQWYSNTANSTTTPTPVALENCTTATYSSASTSSVGTIYYYCVVTNTTGSCSANSDIVAVTVTAPTAISSHPSSIDDAVVGEEQTLTVSATGTGTLTYQWYTCAANGSNAVAIDVEDNESAVEATLLITPSTAGTTYYKCKVHSSCGDDVYSNVASILAKNGISPTLTYANSVTYGSTISPLTSGTWGDGSVTYSLNSVNPANSLSINSSTGVVSGDAAGGTATVTATIAEGTDYWGGSVTSGSITVAKANLSVTATAGEATSVTHNSATLPFELSSTTGVASVTLNVYDASDDSEPVKTVSGVTAATSGSASATGLSASTTYYFTVTPIGDSNHNNGSESDKSATFTTSAAPTLTAISADVLYQAADMANITFTGSDLYWAGFSTNNLFQTYGNGTSSSAKGKTISSTSVTDDISTKNFTSHAYIEGSDVTSGTADPTYGAIEFTTPSTAGLLYVYTVDGSSSNLKLRKKGSSTFTALTGSSNYNAIAVDANSNYYIHGNASKRGIYGIQYVSTYAVTITPTNVTKETGDETAIKGKAYTATFTANDGYELPDDATVTIASSPATKGSEYTWSVTDGTATLTIAAASVTGAISISVSGDKSEEHTITYNPMGGSVDPTSETVTTATLPTPTHASGYSFLGWYTTDGTQISGTYHPTANITLYAKWQGDCAGGGGGSAVLFSQSFNSATAVAYKDGDGQSYTTSSTLSNCVGSGSNLFTSLTCVSGQSSSGIAVNSSSGAGKTDATGVLQVRKKNGSYYWSIIRTSDFAATAPTALKVSMDLWYDNLSSGSNVGVQFAIGADFEDGLMSTSPQSTSNVHSGFNILDNSTAKLAQYASTTAISENGITQETWLSLVWIINNTGSSLTYDEPDGSGKTTLADDKFDIWLKTKAGAINTFTKVVSAQAATTGTKALQNIYIGGNGGSQHLFMLDSIVVTDLNASGSCYTVTYDGNGATSGYVSDPAQYESGTTVYVYDAAGSYTRTGYEFNGWNTTAAGDGEKVSYFTITENTTLFAQWKYVIDSNNEDFAGYDAAPTQYQDVLVTKGATLTLTKSTNVHDITVETGSTLNVSTDGGSAITLATNSLSLVGGWGTVGNETKYDMPRVYIDPASKITKTVKTINFDIAVDNRNFYPIAVPFPVAVRDVNYADAYLAYYALYGTSGQYVIKTYDGQFRANNGSITGCWRVMRDGYRHYAESYGEASETLQPGQGYILRALPANASGWSDEYAIIRFPMKNVDDKWTAAGEKGSIVVDEETVTKNVVPVTAYLKQGDAEDAGDKTPMANRGWNILGVPYMSCYTTATDMGTSAIIKGRFNYETNKWEDGDIRYVTVPTHDFSEYIQANIEDEETPTVLLPGWCFFVQIGTTGNLTFVAADEAASTDLPYRAPKQEQAMPTVKTGIILTGANAKDKTTILVSDKYSAAEYEINADLEKMFGENGYTLATYTLSGETRLAYNAMNNADIMDVIPVGYRAPEEGEYTFSINPRYAESEAFEQVNLIDYQEGVITNLLQSSYSFTTARTQNDARFAINVVKRQDMPTDIENDASGINDANGPRKVLINDKMYIIVDGKMYDATGKAVK